MKTQANLSGATGGCSHANCNEDSECPISLGPCPGICIYSMILHNLQIGIIVFDLKQHKVEFQNQTAVDILSPKIKAKDYDAIRRFLTSSPEDSLLGFSVSSADNSKLVRMDDRFIGYSVYHIQNEDYLWIFISDITEKKRFESIAGAVNTMENIGYIFSGIRHEVGNPINSIKMTLSVLKEQLHTFPVATIEEYLDRSLNELARVEFLLRSLKNINMFEKAEVELVDLEFFLNHFLTLIEEDFSRKGIQINKEVSPDARWILVDQRPLQQVLLNLFTNAADALREQEHPCITITAHQKNGLVWIKVSDNGCGIPKDNLNRIFKPFFTTKSQGSGLGLLLSKKMLARMNCTIDVDSDEKKGGTTFTLSIPEGTDAG